KSSWRRSSPACRRAGWPAPPRSALPWGRWSTSTTPASTSPSPSPTPARPRRAGSPRSPKKPHWTGATCCAPPSPSPDATQPGVVGAYKNLKYVERDFRHLKSDDLDLRPVFHRLEDRVRAHVLICMLACYLTWHLRHAWAPLTFTDEQPPTPASPAAPAQRSA